MGGAGGNMLGGGLRVSAVALKGAVCILPVTPGLVPHCPPGEVTALTASGGGREGRGVPGNRPAPRTAADILTANPAAATPLSPTEMRPTCPERAQKRLRPPQQHSARGQPQRREGDVERSGPIALLAYVKVYRGARSWIGQSPAFSPAGRPHATPSVTARRERPAGGSERGAPLPSAPSAAFAKTPDRVYGRSKPIFPRVVTF